GACQKKWIVNRNIEMVASLQVSPETPSASHRVLVVDDFRPWREFVRSFLAEYAQFQIVGEGRDGVEAVMKARELTPDLILLDIGLPKLNGIEAASQIHSANADAKIIFVSENNSPEILAAALNNGARGYVRKADARSELLPAIETVLRGERFVSQRLNR